MQINKGLMMRDNPIIGKRCHIYPVKHEESHDHVEYVVLDVTTLYEPIWENRAINNQIQRILIDSKISTYFTVMTPTGYVQRFELFGGDWEARVLGVGDDK